MKKYEVTFKIYNDHGANEMKRITVEAGNKRIAMIRAIQQINGLPGYSEKYKDVLNVEEVA